MAGLSFTQVSTWFINARKRVWKPLIHENADHHELTGATLRSTLDSGQESEPGANSDSDASTNSEFEHSERGTVKHSFQFKDSRSRAHCASEDMQDAEMQDASEDQAGCVPPLPQDITATAGKMTRFHVHFTATATSPERPFSSHATSPYRLMIQPSALNQHADVVLGLHQQPHEGKQLAETCDPCPGLALFSAAFPTATPCTSPWRDLPLYATSNQLPHTLPPFGTHVATHHIAPLHTTVTCRLGFEILDFMC